MTLLQVSAFSVIKHLFSAALAKLKPIFNLRAQLRSFHIFVHSIFPTIELFEADKPIAKL